MAAVTPVKNKTNVWTWLRQIRPRMLLAIPFIYGMTVVLLLLDLTISLYQAVCFPLYGIAKVHRSEYMSIDRSLLPYLNIIEKVNCVYCSYANGIFAYSREIGARTEQFFCPIKHEHQEPGVHSHYSRFLKYGDSNNFRARSEKLRREISD